MATSGFCRVLDQMDRVLQNPKTLGVAPLPIGVSEGLRAFLRNEHLICGCSTAWWGLPELYDQRRLDPSRRFDRR